MKTYTVHIDEDDLDRAMGLCNAACEAAYVIEQDPAAERGRALRRRQGEGPLLAAARRVRERPVIHPDRRMTAPVERSAVLSPCGTYRYRLDRRWSDGPTAVWLMLNPSTADAEQDDPTIRKVVGFSKLWGYAAATVVNLYAYRATDPKALRDARRAGIDVVGPGNTRAITTAFDTPADLAVVAWGANAALDSPVVLQAVSCLTAGGDAVCLGRCKGGQPRHPLMLAYDTPREAW